MFRKLLYVIIVNKFSHFFALFCSIFFLSILIIFQLSFVINWLSLEVASVPIAFLVALYISKKYISPLNLLILASIFITAGAYSYFLFDKAGDGRWYHQQAMILLRYLWNPLANYSNLQNNDPLIFSKSYPIANNIIATGFYLLTKSIQIGKSINTIFALYCMSVSYIFLEEFSAVKKKSDIFLISLLASFNPIVCSQLFSYYLDANLYCCFVILMFSSYAYLNTFAEKKVFWLLILLSSFWLISNIKATGLIYGVSTIFIINIMCYLRNKVRFNSCILMILFLGECFLGWHPYIQNILARHHIFWPVMGKNAIDIFIIARMNVSFYPKALYPILSYIIPYPLNFDIFTWLPEFRTYARADARFGACGPLFGVLLILSSLVLFKNLKVKKLQKLSNPSYCIFVMLVVVLVTILINPKWWLARYVPQICLLPILALILLINNQVSLWNKYKWLILSAFIVNSMMFFCGSLILTAYRSHLFFNMENECKKHQCTLMITNSIFKMSLMQQLKDDKVDFSLGSCERKNIIWKDAKSDGILTHVMCLN